jgi:hypothetical protein
MPLLDSLASKTAPTTADPQWYFFALLVALLIALYIMINARKKREHSANPGEAERCKQHQQSIDEQGAILSSMAQDLRSEIHGMRLESREGDDRVLNLTLQEIRELRKSMEIGLMRVHTRINEVDVRNNKAIRESIIEGLRDFYQVGLDARQGKINGMGG